VARRSRSSVSPLWLAAGAAFLVLVFAAGAYYLAKNGDPYRTVEPLEIGAYLENSNSLRGNVYRLTGEVQNVLAVSLTEGKLISVGVEATDDVVPIIIPAALNRINIQKGQKFIFLIEVSDKGILRAKELTKA
jgi:hypothetical protein